jgi:ribosomal protein S18 acetylase RimI-like enzyme
MILELLPKSLYHASHIEVWGRRLGGEQLAAPLPPRGCTVARLGADAPATARRRLADAMGPSGAAEIGRRLAAGRRAYVVEGPTGVVSYGWVTLGDEQIAEIEGTIRIPRGDAYIWDCATLPAYRGRGLYPALLAAIARDLAEERLAWAWIAARTENVASLRGFQKAGFRRVADVRYRRLWRWRRTRVRRDAVAQAPAVEPLRVVA